MCCLLVIGVVVGEKGKWEHCFMLVCFLFVGEGEMQQGEKQVAFSVT